MDEAEVHALLCASDAHNAVPGSSPPIRNPDTTRRHVLAGAVHVLRCDCAAVATFTITPDPPRGLRAEIFPQALRPAYLQRLAVHQKWVDRDALIGLRCVRRACEIARARGADVLRAEANPDLQRVVGLLRALGFEQFGPVVEEEGRRKVCLQRALG